MLMDNFKKIDLVIMVLKVIYFYVFILVWIIREDRRKRRY